MSVFKTKMHQIRFRVGLRTTSDPTGGAYSAPPDSIAGFKVVLLLQRGRKGMGRKEERGGEGREGYGCPPLFKFLNMPLAIRLNTRRIHLIRLRCRDHISPTLLRLHWLPVRQRVLFKIAVLVYQCLNGLVPSYLADDCQLVSDVRPRRLRSSDSVTCAVRRTRTTYGDRCFAVAGPRVRNSLPTELRQSDSLKTV